MKWPTLAFAAILATALVGCGGSESDEGEPSETPEAAPAEATPPAEAAPTTVPASRPAPPAAIRTAAIDEPWTPVHTGTVNPGMSRDEVIGVWGEPVTERSADGRTYLYFRNGCEASCGTFDVVFLEGNQVVDAIVRGQGHSYSGTSSSPPGSEGKPTLPGPAGI
jgi:hypothetical protein